VKLAGVELSGNILNAKMLLRLKILYLGSIVAFVKRTKPIEFINQIENVQRNLNITQFFMASY
jgi:hypothetical protein